LQPIWPKNKSRPAKQNQKEIRTNLKDVYIIVYFIF
jgi:hypothetical protein